MILTQEPILLESNMVGKKIRFKIDQDSDVIPSFLRNNIYSHPVRAIVQEILSNSKDSVGESSDNLPIVCFLPGNEFIVKDQGVGMSHQFVEDVLSWYGRSTKSKTNTQIGGFGIGFKAVLQNNSHSVLVAIKDGIKNTYVNFVDEKGAGIQPVSSEKTDEHDGVEIRIPVPHNQREEYRREALRCTFYWDNPRVVFPGELKHQTPKISLRGTNWFICEDNPYEDYNIILGGIPYQCFGYGEIPRGLILEFPVESLTPNLARDTIQSTEENRKAIRDAKANYQKEIASKLADKIQSCVTFGDVIQILHSVPGANSFQSQKWNWQGKEFVYPLEKQMQRIHRPYTKLDRSKVYRFNNGGKELENSIILRDKDLTVYDSARIGSYLKQPDSPRVVYLVEPGQVPVSGIPLSSIKVVRATPSPGSKKVKPNTIRGRTRRYKKFTSYDIDTQNVRLYTTEDVDNISSTHLLGQDIIQIHEKDFHLIEDEDLWVGYADYLKEELFDKLSDQEIQAIAQHIKAKNNYDRFAFLANHHKDFSCLKPPAGVKGVERYAKLVQFALDNRLVATPEIDLLKGYPMLTLMNHWVYQESHQMIKDYIDLVNNSQKLS